MKIMNTVLIIKKSYLRFGDNWWYLTIFTNLWQENVITCKEAVISQPILKFVTLKSDFHLPKKISAVYFIEILLKMIKHAFDFIIKALFVIKIFKFW